MATKQYGNQTGPTGVNSNMGGTKMKIFWAPIDSFTTIADLPSAPATAADYSTISANHVLGAGKAWNEMYCTLNKGEQDDTLQGEIDGRSYKQTAKLFYPGTEQAALGIMNQVMNDKVIVLVPLANGAYKQIGSEDFPAELVCSAYKSGTNSGGINGMEIAVESMGPKMLIYAGTI